MVNIVLDEVVFFFLRRFRGPGHGLVKRWDGSTKVRNTIAKVTGGMRRITSTGQNEGNGGVIHSSMAFHKPAASIT